MATTACFVIVSRNDIPIYEAEVGSAAKREDAAQLHQFILHAALDIVQDLAWTTSAMYLKAIDRFNDLVVSVYVTAVYNFQFDAFLDWTYIHDLCYFMTPVMMMVSRASSKRFMSSISRLFLIPSTCLVPESLHRILIPKFVPLHENICRGHASCGKTSP
ncbi:trafficking protein particle complex subunit 2 isoform X1 [Prunus yedoensis var. nudiflora]|uniref:Trafficking protein particle complex subunit 2 isoform X1 n=1 Tax=Prunus yedoensis var. nudiflora TaxID=2094558 RepID=A0A314V3S7_PRUYE|nr:trafficking protein particle complex subunit 2 isoform X1 [Prunus yedoensis var. nudiflora]